MAVTNAADSAVDINRLIHTDRQTAPQTPQKSPSDQIQPPRLPQDSGSSQPSSSAGSATTPTDEQNADLYDEFVPSKNPRYDEFDWVLTKVGKSNNFLICNKEYDDNYICLTNSLFLYLSLAVQNVLAKNQSNTIISPFLVKLLLSVLAEAAGSGTSTERELQTIWPSIQTNIKTREHYSNIFKSLKV